MCGSLVRLFGAGLIVLPFFIALPNFSQVSKNLQENSTLRVAIDLVLLDVSVLFADIQAVECCARDGCNSRSETDDCCQGPLPGSAKYYQAEPNVSKEIFHSYVSFYSRINVSLTRDMVSPRTSRSDIPFDAPPVAPDGSLPLLI